MITDQITTPVDPFGYLLFGGTSQREPEPGKPHPYACAGMSRMPYKWSDDPEGSLPSVAEHYAEQISNLNLKRILLHSIGGNWIYYPTDSSKTAQQQKIDAQQQLKIPYDRATGMWIDGWLVAEKLGLGWANRDKLALMHYLFVDAGIKEVLYYLGAPNFVNYAIQKESLRPFIKLRGASFGFDAVYSKEHFEQCLRIWKWIKRQNPTARIYTEARPHLEVPAKFARYLDGSIASAKLDRIHPSLLENAKQFGEVLTLVDTNDECPEGQTPIAKKWAQQQ